jgi:phosphoglycolate phosphatase
MDLLIFDLDGTLIDSKKDLVNAVNATRAHMLMPPLSDETVASYIGNGAPVLIRRALGEQATEDQVKEALEFFIEYYRDHALDFTRLYEGVEPSLERLSAAGVDMAVLTNKPVRISRFIVDGLGLTARFGQVYGGNSFDFKKPNPIGIQRLMEEFGVARERTMMVGDSAVDIQTARNAQVKSCGVTYGFQPETLHEPRPDILVDRMQDLADWVLDQRNGPSRELRG